MNDRWLSVEEIAAYLGIKRETLYKWLAEKNMPAHKVGRLNPCKSIFPYRSMILIILIFVSAQLSFSQIVINEFMASNDTTFSDIAGEFDDWIELASVSNDTINLFGWFISDRQSNLTKHQFTDSLYIYPDSLFLFWADDDENQGPNHLSFKLSSGGEAVYLTTPNFDISDSVTFGQQTSDVSYGRFPNYTGTWGLMSSPTPGQVNLSHDSTEYSPDAIVSVESGFYESPLSIHIYSDYDDVEIYYTLDGSTPDSNAIHYTETLELNQTTALRVITNRQEYHPSQVQSYNYILNSEHSLPTMALTIDPIDFPIGVEEYNVHVTYFEQNGNVGFKADAGIERHGSPSPQNPYRISFKSEYGTSYIEYPIFSNRSYHKYKRLVLRNASNDRFPNNGNVNRAHLRDGIIHAIYEKLYPEGGYSSFQSLHVYINELYWGIYHLRERQDKYYVEELFGYDDVDLLERAFGFPGNKNAIEGDWSEYEIFEEFIETEDMSIDENFNYLKDNIYYDEFLDYWILEIFAGNFDWLSNNIKYFRPKSGEDKWRWLLWDVDHGLGMDHYYDGIHWGEPETDYLDWSTGLVGPRVGAGANNRIIRAILRNNQGRIDFVNRSVDLLNTVFLEENMLRTLDSLADILTPDMHFQADRWGGNLSDWDTGLENVRNYVLERPFHMINHIKNKFDLDTTYQISLDLQPSHLATIQINTIQINEFPWSGSYFSNIPITITVDPLPGYEVVQWNGANVTSNSIVIDSLIHDTSFSIILAPISNQSLVINEIMANQDSIYADEQGDFDDWVEVYNASNSTIDIAGMIFSDGEEIDTIPSGFPTVTTVEAKDYIIVWFDKDSEDGPLHLEAKLSGDGESIIITDVDGVSVLDSYIFGAQSLNISEGRAFDSGHIWGNFTTPTPGSSNGMLFINEFMASNESTIADDSSEFDDWVEIYNSSSLDIDLAGLGFGDSHEEAHFIPSGFAETVISAGGYTLVWFDDASDQGPLHIDEKLGGEDDIYLYDTTGFRIIDFYDYDDKYDDISEGRFPDGGASWDITFTPTPGLSNVYTEVVFGCMDTSASNYDASANMDDGSCEYLSIDEDGLPNDFALHQNYPNPFNPTTSINYDLPEEAFVSIRIYDLRGRLVSILVNKEQTAGYKAIKWDGVDDKGQLVSAGIYLYEIQASEFRQTKKMVLLK